MEGGDCSGWSSLTTPAPPTTAQPVRRTASCFTWVHLQATICTEWAQERMCIVQRSRGRGSQTEPAAPPRTIHRCILLEQAASGPGGPGRAGLQCHVCSQRYPDYRGYYRHLLDQRCLTVTPGYSLNCAPAAAFKRAASPAGAGDTAAEDSDLEIVSEQWSSGPHKLRRLSSPDLCSDSDTENLSLTEDSPAGPAERAASETLLQLSGGPPCPCQPGQPRISNMAAARDEARLAQLRGRLGAVLGLLLGRERLQQLGEPGLPGHLLLEKVLRLTGTSLAGEKDLCSKHCKVINPSSNVVFVLRQERPERGDEQVQWRFLRARLAALEKNTEAFLKICTPDTDVWDRFGWRGKHVHDIIEKILEDGQPVL